MRWSKEMDITNLCLSVDTEKYKPYMFHFESDEIIGERNDNIFIAWDLFLLKASKILVDKIIQEEIR